MWEGTRGDAVPILSNPASKPRKRHHWFDRRLIHIGDDVAVALTGCPEDFHRFARLTAPEHADDNRCRCTPGIRASSRFIGVKPDVVFDVNQDGRKGDVPPGLGIRSLPNVGSHDV